MDKEEIMLSICIPTYNHEEYIKQALDSVLMQETQYSYEVLVGEDASTDNTRKILKEYERIHPGKIKVFYHEHNLHKQKKYNWLDLIMKSKGKYVNILEGDDYWFDKNKIEKQITFLEEHPEYIACACNCIVVDEYSEQTDENYPECKKHEYTLNDYAKDIMPGQLATVMMRNVWQTNECDYSVTTEFLMPADRLIYFMLLCNGRIFCFQETMSAYRHVIHKGSSYSATYKFDFESTKIWHLSQIEYAEKIKNKKAINIAKMLYFMIVRLAVNEEFITDKYGFQSLRLVNWDIAALFTILKRRMYNLKLKIYKVKALNSNPLK